MFYDDLVTAINDYSENQFPTETVNRFIEQAEQRIYNSVQIPALRKNVTGQVTPTNTYLACPSDWLSTFSLACYTYAYGSIVTTSGSNAVTVTGSSGNSVQAGMMVTATGIPANTIILSVVSGVAYLSANATASGTVQATFQGPYTYLLNKDVNFIREAFSYPVTNGTPQYYAVFGPQTSNQFGMTYILGPTPDQIYKMELHYNAYPLSIIQAQIGSFEVIYSTDSSLYPLASQTYYNVDLSGGIGSGAIANIVTSNTGTLTVTLINPGTGYAVNDQLYAPIYTVSQPSIVQSVPVIQLLSVLNPAGETWLGDEFDVALLNYSLMESITYTKGEQDLVVLYKSRGDEALALLKQLCDAKEQGDAYRNGLPRYKVT